MLAHYLIKHGLVRTPARVGSLPSARHVDTAASARPDTRRSPRKTYAAGARLELNGLLQRSHACVRPAGQRQAKWSGPQYSAQLWGAAGRRRRRTDDARARARRVIWRGHGRIREGTEADLRRGGDREPVERVEKRAQLSPGPVLTRSARSSIGRSSRPLSASRTRSVGVGTTWAAGSNRATTAFGGGGSRSMSGAHAGSARTRRRQAHRPAVPAIAFSLRRA
jgi:hypothetical protein